MKKGVYVTLHACIAQKRPTLTQRSAILGGKESRYRVDHKNDFESIQNLRYFKKKQGSVASSVR